MVLSDPDNPYLDDPDGLLVFLIFWAAVAVVVLPVGIPGYGAGWLGRKVVQRLRGD